MKYCAVLLLWLLSAASYGVKSQSAPPLSYYLPDIAYNPAIPTPASWLGFEVGAWHASHDQLVGYLRALDAASDRIRLQEYGRSYENRPLLCLMITDPGNFPRLEQIKADRQRLADPGQSGGLDLKSMPAVYYMGYSIHGNEASGSNAALIMAYYLAAAESEEVKSMLKNTVILFDPCFNPDGMQRFSTWVNSHKSIHLSPDPAGDEFNEHWPRGRTNHYGFDLNRDWLVAQQPETVGRVQLFQEWRPNLLTDQHEMGTNSSFFFQPGVASRVNPITPDKNQELTAKIAGYHAQLLSENNVLFFTGENYDDFYYGKGSTYPDAQGCIGILFEQGSSRGTAQESENGLLTFPYSIRNQVFGSLSSLKAISDMRVELNEYMRDFYRSALDEAKHAEVKGYLFSDGSSEARAFLELLGRQHIRVQNVEEDIEAGSIRFKARQAFFVPCEQAQYRLVRAIFERNTVFRDSIFYDISAWTLPDAFGLDWAPLKAGNYSSKSFSKDLSLVSLHPPYRLGDHEAYAYAIAPEAYELPRVLGRLLRAGLRVRVAMEPFKAAGEDFRAGALLIAADRQAMSASDLVALMNEAAGSGLHVVPIENGLTPDGPDLGSSNFPVVRLPKILELTGDGVDPSANGEIWHQFDTRYDMPVTRVEAERFNSLNLLNYNVLVLSDGVYSKISSEKVKQFVNDGGTLIVTGTALRWLKNTALAPVDFRISAPGPHPPRPYDKLEEDKGAMAMPGAIFQAELDLTHPLCFGYDKPELPVFFSDTIFVQPTQNPYATPLRLSAQPLLGGYVHARYKALASGAAAALVYGSGKGKIIAFPGDMNFRAFWYGTNRIFANAVFFGNLINGDSTERK